jgi:hypothetical protein
MKYTLLGLLLLLSMELMAKSHFWERKQLSIQSTSNVIGMPNHIVNGRLHPGLELGIASSLRKTSRRNYLDYQFHLGYFSQRFLQQNLYLKPSLGYAFKVYKSIHIRPSLHGAFMLNRQKNDEFKYTGNGQYEKVSPYRFQFMPGLGLSLWGKAYSAKRWTLYPTLGYEFGMQLPFSSISSLLPLNQLKIGIRLAFSHSKS